MKLSTHFIVYLLVLRSNCSMMTSYFKYMYFFKLTTIRHMRFSSLLFGATLQGSNKQEVSRTCLAVCCCCICNAFLVTEPAEVLLTANVVKADFRTNNSLTCIGTGRPLKSVDWNTAGYSGMTSTLRATEEYHYMTTAMVKTLHFVGRDVVRRPGTSITVECIADLERHVECTETRTGNTTCPGFRWRHSKLLRIDIECKYFTLLLLSFFILSRMPSASLVPVKDSGLWGCPRYNKYCSNLIYNAFSRRL